MAETNAVDPNFERVTEGSTTSVPLRLLFIGRGSREWAQFRDAVRLTLGDTVDIIMILAATELNAKRVAHVDIVFVHANGRLCDAKSNLAIRAACPLASIIPVTTAPRASDAVQADRHVIHLAKSCPVPMDKILDVIFVAMQRRICALKLALSACEPERPAPSRLLERLFVLTPQERRVLEAVRQGKPNKLVAKQLNITVRTVKAHLTEIFRKTGLAQRAELIAKCSELVASQATFLTDDASDLKPRRHQPALLPFARRASPRAGLIIASPPLPRAQHAARIST